LIGNDILQKNPTMIPVVAAALVAADGRVLLQKRKSGAQHAGLWEFPGGKIEHGESPETALVREIEEELGVILAVDSLQALTFASDPALPHVILLYMCRDWPGDPRCLDGEAIRWFHGSELAELAMPPLDYPLARALLTAI
jgi:8-oxo-dGTP diphosphatase